MAFGLYRLLLVLLLTGEGFSQCFDSTGCTGSLVGAVHQRDCCVGTNNGLSFNNGGICTNCIGIDSDKLAAKIYFSEYELFSVVLQSMGSVRQCMNYLRMPDWTLSSDIL